MVYLNKTKLKIMLYIATLLEITNAGLKEAI